MVKPRPDPPVLGAADDLLRRTKKRSRSRAPLREVQRMQEANDQIYQLIQDFLPRHQGRPRTLNLMKATRRHLLDFAH